MDLRRVDDLPDYVFDRIAEWRREAARRGREIVDLGIGSPDLARRLPSSTRLRGVARTREPRLSLSSGGPEPREGVADWYADRHGVTLDPNPRRWSRGAPARP